MRNGFLSSLANFNPLNADRVLANHKESVQPEQTFHLCVIAITHSLHEDHVFPHHRTEKTAKARNRPQCFERRRKIRPQQRPNNWRGHSLSILRSQYGEWI